MERGAVARRRGRPRVRPDRVGGDKGYTGRKIRGYLRRRGIGAVIPRLRNEPRRGVRFDRAAYRERNVVERAVRRLKRHRAIATRYEKLAAHYHPPDHRLHPALVVILPTRPSSAPVSSCRQSSHYFTTHPS
jgi:transposase